MAQQLNNRYQLIIKLYIDNNNINKYKNLTLKLNNLYIISLLLDYLKQHNKNITPTHTLYPIYPTYSTYTYTYTYTYIYKYMNKKTQDKLLIQQLCMRFQRKPRKCKKKNDSGIGQSQRIVCISNDRFYYYPKIQEFNDLDFDKLQYVVPKAGIKLVDILQLKFPPRRNNQRNYFTITIPNNRIQKYTKTFKQMIIDQYAQGEQDWTFIFNYDIISLPELEKRLQVVKTQQKEKMMKRKQKQQEDFMKKQQQTRKKLEQEYQSLVQTQKMISEKQGQPNKTIVSEKEAQSQEKVIQQADQYYFHQAYQKLKKVNPNNQTQVIQSELDLLESIGRFRMRAQKAVRKYIDELPFNLSPNLDKIFSIDNLIVRITFSKHLNMEFLDSMKVAYALYANRQKIQGKIRVPLMALIKYKGLKVLVRAVTQCDFYNEKQRQELFMHGSYLQNWKTHFFLLDDLNNILQTLNLKPYNSQIYFQRIVIHLGVQLQMISTKQDPFQKIKRIKHPSNPDLTKQRIIYAFNIKQVFPIDLDLDNNIKQDDIRLRPEFVESYKDKDVGAGKQPTKLAGGALTYQYQDQQGNKDDLALAKASQHLKYVHLLNFVQDLDKLKHIPMNSEHLRKIMKQNGINTRYISVMFKLTNLPYLRQMITIQAIAREIKKIYQEYQTDFMREVFRNSYADMMKEAFDSKSMNSLKVIRKRQLLMKQRQKSIQNSIDFLNLVFGNGAESQNFWEIVKKKVKQSYKITVKQHSDLSHGYLLLTILYHCGFGIKINRSLLLFSSSEPFSNKDWTQFKCKTKFFTYPSLQVYKKCRITPELTEQAIINRLQLSLYICRALGNDQSKILSQLATYTKNPQIFSGQKFSIDFLKYYVTNASLQNFQKAYDVITFVLPSSHPYFQDFYLAYASLKTSDSVILKKAAQNHAIRTLGISHWKTSSILSNFYQQSYLKHLIQAEAGVELLKKMELYHKIVTEQARLGKFIDCFKYVKISINFASARKQLNTEQQDELFRLLMIGMETTYKLRKIQDLLKISEHFWNYLEKFRPNTQESLYLEHILYYCVKGYLQSSNKKYYLFKIILVLIQKTAGQKQTKKQSLLQILRQKCRQSKNHINWIKQLLTKLQFAYTQMNFLPDFFTHFWQNVQKMHSQELDQGLDQMTCLVRLFKKRYFQEALLDRSYTFDKGSQWDVPKAV